MPSWGELQRQAELLPDNLAGVIEGLGRYIGNSTNSVEPNFVGVTQGYFLGHAARVDMDETPMVPRASFELALADTIAPWRARH